MAEKVYKAKMPIQQDGKYYYPLTSYDQIIMPNGEYWDGIGIGGKVPKYYIQPRNLLDNSDFRNPVNQRGQTVYTGSGYTIDRWRLTNAYSKLEIVNDGIRASCMDGGTYAYPRQIVDGTKFGGKTFTGVWCFNDGSVYTTTGTFPDEEVTADTIFASVNVGEYRLTLAKLKNGNLCHQARVPIGETLTLKWAALYEGTYTVDTLPPYVPKGYVAELLECRQYVVPVKTACLAGYTYGSTSEAQFFIPLSIPLFTFNLHLIQNHLSSIRTD